MIFQIHRVTVISVEMFDKRRLPSPHKYFMLRITKMRGKARAKVARPKYQDFGRLRRLFSGVHLGREKSATAMVG